jgi:hypothetical protein
MYISYVIEIYVVTVLYASSFVLNLICSIGFIIVIKSMRHQHQSSNQMFKYLLLKSLCDMLSGLIRILWPIYFYSKLRQKYFIQVWYIWFHEYLSNVLYLASGMFEIAASFDCAISIEKKMKWCQSRITFYVTTFLIFAFCASLLSYEIFIYIITDDYHYNKDEVLVHSYHVSRLVSYSKLIFKMVVVKGFIRDFIPLFVLMIINLFILFKMVQIRKRKAHLQTSRNSTVIAAEKAENRKVKMITFLFLIFIIGHFPYFIIDILEKYTLSSDFFFNFETFCNICLNISLLTPIISYYLFNQKFKSIFS